MRYTINYLLQNIFYSLILSFLFSGCSHRFENSENQFLFEADGRDLDEILYSRYPDMDLRESIYRDGMQLLRVEFSEIEGWYKDSKKGSLLAFVRGCEQKSRVNIPEICEEAKRIYNSNPSNSEITSFFENYFTPYLIIDLEKERISGLVTGYYVPILNGSRTKHGKYRYPIYAKPKDFHIPYKTHQEIDEEGIDADVICWVDDRIDRFFLHIQGSGIVKLDDGTTIGIGYVEQNGYPYRSIGGYIHRTYGVPLHKLSAQYIKNWLKKHPDLVDEVLYHNKSFVFFREQKSNLAFGAMGTNLVPKSTIAVDTRYTPLGMPIYIQSDKNRNLNHLFMAQDRGGAIKGVIRADLFYGFGEEAGREAGRTKVEGEFYMLLPYGFEFTD